MGYCADITPRNLARLLKMVENTNISCFKNKFALANEQTFLQEDQSLQIQQMLGWRVKNIIKNEVKRCRHRLCHSADKQSTHPKAKHQECQCASSRLGGR